MAQAKSKGAADPKMRAIQIAMAHMKQAHSHAAAAHDTLAQLSQGVAEPEGEAEPPGPSTGFATGGMSPMGGRAR